MTAERINFPVTPETVAALELVVEREDVAPAEALRRLVAYGEHVYRASKIEHATLLAKTGTETREIVLY